MDAHIERIIRDLKERLEELEEIESQEALEEVFWEYSIGDMISKLLEMGFREPEIKKGLSLEIARRIKELYKNEE